jgi:hypothetical protein
VAIAGCDHYLGPWKAKASKLEYDRLVGEWLAAGRPRSPPGAEHEISAIEVIAAFVRHAKNFYVKNEGQPGRPTTTSRTILAEAAIRPHAGCW